MWGATTILLAVAVGAAVLTWHHATRLDRQQNERRLRQADEHPAAWPLVLGSLVAAVAATTMFQVAVLSSLGR